MNPPARPIRVELTDALVAGIRQRGADAVGLVIMAIAYLVIAVLVLLILLPVSSVFGIDWTATAVSVMSMISGIVSWLIGKSVRSMFRGPRSTHCDVEAGSVGGAPMGELAPTGRR
jgi:hypothetical protein